MKKMIFAGMLAFCSLLAIAFLIPIYAGAQEAKTDTSSVWKIRVNGDGILYLTDGCKVFVPGSGKPLLQIIAIDLDWDGKKLEQVITLEINKEGKIKTRDQRFVLDTSAKTSWLYVKTKGYDVFKVKYREKALKLPPEVKKLFHGFYNIE